MKIRLYSIAIYIHVVWCDILPDSDNHARSVVKFKNRLNQALSYAQNETNLINKSQ